MWLHGWLKLISTGPHTSFPPSQHSYMVYSPSPALLPKPHLQPAPVPVSGFLCTLHLCHRPSSPALCALLGTCQRPALAAHQVLPALEYNQKFLWVFRAFVCGFFSVDQQTLLNSPLLRKINRIFSICSLQYKTKSWKEPEQQLDMNINWYLLMNFAD